MNCECESCAHAGLHGVIGVGHSKNPEWSGYWLCEECLAEYDKRSPINACETDELQKRQKNQS